MTTQRRPTFWVDTLVDSNLATGAAQTLIDLLASVPSADRARFTVIRWIARLIVLPAVIADSTISIMSVSIGLGVTNSDAFAAGASAVPDPAVMAEFPIEGWALRDILTFVNQQDSGTVEAWHFPELRADIRAARKVGRGTAFMGLRSLPLIAGTSLVKVTGIVRCLVKA